MSSNHSSVLADGVKKGKLDTGHYRSCQDILSWAQATVSHAEVQWTSAIGCGLGSLVTKMRVGDGLEGATKVRWA